jgi:hypothetical protein
MVGSRLLWGRKRQLSRVKLNLTCNFCREVYKTMAWHWLGGATNAPKGEFGRAGHDASQATVHLENSQALYGGEIAKTTDAQQTTILQPVHGFVAYSWLSHRGRLFNSSRRLSYQCLQTRTATILST